MVEARTRFLRGVAVLNAVLIPIAALGLYLAYLGRHSGDKTVLVAGIAVTLASPVLAYLIAAPLVELLENRQRRHRKK